MLRLNNYIVDEYIRREKEERKFDFWEFCWQLSTSASSIILGAIEGDINRPGMKPIDKMVHIKNLIRKEKEARQLINLIVDAEMKCMDSEKNEKGGNVCIK
jgi:hypothetical protein